MYRLEIFPVGAFQCNCTILAHENTKEAIVVDPGDESELILERIDAMGLKVRALWHTHAHLDHVGATKTLLEEFTRRNGEAPKVWLHEGDRWLYDNVAVQCSMMGMPTFEVTKTFDAIRDGQRYEGFDGLRAVHTPGHTPGSCCLRVDGVGDVEHPRSLAGSSGEGKKYLLSGDTLFRRSIGRTDLWGGDSQQILTSIRGKLMTLDPGTLVVPGHGPLTTIEEENEKNPFVGKRA